MGVIHIEDIDERVMKSLQLRACKKGRSLEDEIRELLTEAATPQMSAQERSELSRRAQSMTPEEFAVEAEQIRAMTPKGVEQTDSTRIIREFRDRGYASR